MILSDSWVRKRWMEFRTGYSMYLVFLFGFSNFLLILYNFVLEISEIIDFLPFLILVIFIIIPISVLAGQIHNKKQLPIEAKVQSLVNPFRDHIVPQSKEELNTSLAIWNLQYNRWFNEYITLSLQITKSNLEYKKIEDAKVRDDDELASKDLLEIDSWIKKAEEQRKMMQVWENRLSSYMKGQKASEVLKSD